MDLNNALQAIVDKIEDNAPEASNKDLAFLASALEKAKQLSGGAQLDAAISQGISDLQTEAAAQLKNIEESGGGSVDLLVPDKSFTAVVGTYQRHQVEARQATSTKTQFGKPYNNLGKRLFELFLGSPSTANFNANFAHKTWYKHPSLFYFDRKGDNWGYEHQGYNFGDDRNYPKMNLAAVFIQNDNAVDVQFDLWHTMSSSWSSGYEGASLNMGIPNKTTEELSSVSEVIWQTLHSFTGNTGSYTQKTPITIPAKKTVVLLKYASPFYYNTYGNIIFYFSKLGFGNTAGLIKNNVKINKEKTLALLQGSFQDEIKFWKGVKQ